MWYNVNQGITANVIPAGQKIAKAILFTIVGRDKVTRKDVQVSAEFWLQSKSVAEFIQEASKYKSSIWIEKDEKRANAKSMLGILALSVADSKVIALVAVGEDEAVAVNELEEYISSHA